MITEHPGPHAPYPPDYSNPIHDAFEWIRDLQINLHEVEKSLSRRINDLTNQCKVLKEHNSLLFTSMIGQNQRLAKEKEMTEEVIFHLIQRIKALESGEVAPPMEAKAPEEILAKCCMTEIGEPLYIRKKEEVYQVSRLGFAWENTTDSDLIGQYESEDNPFV